VAALGARTLVAMIIRKETAGDVVAIHQLNELAFGRPAEANLVGALRVAAEPFISLVAEDKGKIVGHISFTAVTGVDANVAGLAPMAVLPGQQRKGIGALLVTAGLETCRRAGFTMAVVLGHPEYYPRFGFRPASQLGLRSEYDVPDPVFMAMELSPGAAVGLEGVVRYHDAFATV
jgi:putative acetyltransferase